MLEYIPVEMVDTEEEQLPGKYGRRRQTMVVTDTSMKAKIDTTCHGYVI